MPISLAARHLPRVKSLLARQSVLVRHHEPVERLSVLAKDGVRLSMLRVRAEASARGAGTTGGRVR